MAVVAAAEEEKSPAILQVLVSHTLILTLELILIINVRVVEDLFDDCSLCPGNLDLSSCTL